MITKIIADLNEKYESDWKPFVRVPKLKRMLEERFRDQKFLLQSVCEYQRQFGFDQTQVAINVFFNLFD